MTEKVVSQVQVLRMADELFDRLILGFLFTILFLGQILLLSEVLSNEAQTALNPMYKIVSVIILIFVAKPVFKLAFDARSHRLGKAGLAVCSAIIGYHLLRVGGVA